MERTQLEQLLDCPEERPSYVQCGARADLEQYFTPEWAALRLREWFLPDLTSNDCVIDAACGGGVFLKTIPANVPALGVELDPYWAEQSRANTGRQVICGDFRNAEIPLEPTVFFGNPPWSVNAVNHLLDRAWTLLPFENGRCGFVLPAHRLSYSGPVLELARRWDIEQTLLPKSIFPRLAWPVVFAVFRKLKSKRLRGFFLFEEAEAVKGMAKGVRGMLISGRPRTSLWRAVVEDALTA